MNSAIGPLEGMTILRYANAYESGGGMEQYLWDLNGELSRRNALNTVEVQLTTRPDRVAEAESRIGIGRIVRVSLFVDQCFRERAVNGTGPVKGLSGRLTNWLRDRLFAYQGAYPAFARHLLARRRIPKKDGEPEFLGSTVRALLRRFAVDLICLHSAGGAETSEVLDAASDAGIPVAYVHHFANERLCSFAMRAQIERLDGLACASGIGIPRFVKKTAVNVSDGIDTEFFERRFATPQPQQGGWPVILHVARITSNKGQADSIRALSLLRRKGLKAKLVLAGRVDSQDFLQELQTFAATEGLSDSVVLTGPLNPAELRDWYATASVLAFPTYSEALGRVSLEAQAMQCPPVIYDSGGTSEALDDGKTGFLLRKGDVAGLAQRLWELLSDESLRRAMGIAGRQFVEKNFSLAALAARHERFYLDIIKRRSSKTTALA